jgi:hypothetical protein
MFETEEDEEIWKKEKAVRTTKLKQSFILEHPLLLIVPLKQRKELDL